MSAVLSRCLLREKETSARTAVSRMRQVIRPAKDSTEIEGLMMIEAMQLKICEGCGRLWCRAAATREVYCAGCVDKLSDYPLAGMERRPGRKRRRLLVAQAGAQ